MPRPVRSPRSLPLLRRAAALAAVAVLAEIFAHGSGVRFDANAAELAGNFYLLDPALLQHDLLRSLFALHAQPPLFNLLAGAALKLSPAHWPQLLHAFFFLCSAATLIGCDRLAIRLGAAPRVSFGAAALLGFSPAFILYQHALMTELPAACALIWMLVFGIAAPRTRRLAALAALACVTACLFKPFFAPAFALAIALTLAWRQRPRIALAAFAPLLLLAALVIKNGLVLDSFATSSWLGMNLARTSVSRIPPRERTQLIASGSLSPLAALEPLSPAPDYRAAMPELCPRREAVMTGQALALSADFKESGAINLNQACYPRISRLLLRDHLFLLRHRPELIARSWLQALLQFLRPAGEYHFLEVNRPALALWSRLWSLAAVAIPLPEMIEGHTELCLGPLLAYGLALAIALRRRRESGGWLCFLSLSWIALLGVSGELGENNRLRFVSVPIVFALLAPRVRQSLREKTG